MSKIRDRFEQELDDIRYRIEDLIYLAQSIPPEDDAKDVLVDQIEAALYDLRLGIVDGREFALRVSEIIESPTHDLLLTALDSTNRAR